MEKLCYHLLILCLFVFLPLFPAFGNPNAKKVTVRDGLAGSTINALVQDDEGFIWMGTNAGLSRYDGYSMVNFYQIGPGKGQYIDGNIGELKLDKNRKLLWIRSATYHLACYDLLQQQFVDWDGDTQLGKTNWVIRITSAGTWIDNKDQGLIFINVDKGKVTRRAFNTANKGLPSNDVKTLTEDANHCVWIGTSHGIAVIDRNMKPHVINRQYSIKQSRTNGRHLLMLTQNNEVLTFDISSRRLIRCDKLPLAIGAPDNVTSNILWKGLWLLFSNHETIAYDLKSHAFTKPEACQLQGGIASEDNCGYYYASNKKGTFLIFTPQGRLIRLELGSDHTLPNKARPIHARMDRHQQVYIATYGNGLFIYDLKTAEQQHFSTADPYPVLQSDYLQWITADNNGGIWVGLESAGAVCINNNSKFNASYLYPTSANRLDISNNVRSLCPMGDGTLMIGTRDNRLHRLELKTGKIADAGILKETAYTIFRDREGNLWKGTRGDGLYFNDDHYTPQGQLRVPASDFYDIVEDRKGRIWLATWNNGLVLTRPAKGQPLRFKSFFDTGNDYNQKRIHDLELDEKGRLWIASNKGLYVVNTLQPVSQHSIHRVNNIAGLTNSEEIICLHASREALWLGTACDGLIEMKLIDGKWQCHVWNSNHGLSSNCVRSIIEDRKGNLWIGTDAGLTCMNISHGNVTNIRPYQPAPTVQGNVCAENCAMLLKDGRLLFGTTHGLLLLNVNNVTAGSHSSPQPRITNLTINGISVYSPDCHEQNLLENLHDKGRIRLPYKENSLVIYFSNFQYDNISATNYQFRMDGVDEDWQPLTNQNHADYSNLPPGNYQFHVRAQNDQGKWGDETLLSIRILQPWYNSWWAWCLYLIIFGMLAFYFVRNMRERARMHQQMEIDKQVTEFRLNFFTQIAHEFRTPLAIIKGAVDHIFNPETHQVSHEAIQAAKHSTQRLARLITQLMEFRKIETGNMRLQVSQGDIIATVRDIFQDFWNMAQEKELNFTFLPFSKKHLMLFDHQKVEMMVYNLLSNAIKYTPKHGEVKVAVRLDSQHRQVVIQVTDSGKGISPEQRQQLFKPFMHGYASQGGMGIGLYSSYQMAMLHKGNLIYEPRREQQGSVFTLTLPDDEKVYEAKDYRVVKSEVPESQTKKQLEQLVTELQPQALNQQLVAIIEDDPDMAKQLKDTIGIYFRVENYMDCETALNGIPQTLPDLVLCDVMLPDGNGYQIVRKLRKETATRDIPIIMLTAIDDEEHQIEGYKAGADDYMVKPCNYKLLLVRAMQLIKWRLERQQQLANSQAGKPETSDTDQEDTADNTSKNKSSASAPAIIIESSADKQFIDKMNFYINQHLGDPDFNIDVLAAMLNMGRTKFFGKTKELTGMSPNAYIMEQRLQRSAELLKQGELNISEVSYKTGFSTPQYFSKCFREKFGMTPREYKSK